MDPAAESPSATIPWRHYRTRPVRSRAAHVEGASWIRTAPTAFAHSMWLGAWLLACPVGSDYDSVSRGEFRATCDALGLDVAEGRGELTPEMAMRGILGHEALAALARGKARGAGRKGHARRHGIAEGTALGILVRFVLPRLASAWWALRRGDRAAAYAELGSAVGYLAVLVARAEWMRRQRP